ncbi:hypothetical protein LguiA_013205 [Lonicera macranthoides]
MSLNNNSIDYFVQLLFKEIRNCFLAHQEAMNSMYANMFERLGSMLERTFNQYREAMIQPIQSTTPIAPLLVKSLRNIRITSSNLKLYSDGCTICTNSFLINDKTIRLPCQHVYHKDCVVEWLNMSNTCPLCRDKLPSEKNSTEPSLKRRRQSRRQ